MTKDSNAYWRQLIAHAVEGKFGFCGHCGGPKENHTDFHYNESKCINYLRHRVDAVEYRIKILEDAGRMSL